MKVSVFFILLILFTSCAKDNSNAPVDKEISTTSSVVVITGRVSQYDIYDHLSYSNLNSISVKLVGTNLITNCDANGNFTLTNIPKGTYKMEISKIGYGFSGGNITLNSDYNGAFSIGEVPQWNLTLGSGKDTSQTYAGVITQGFSFSIYVNNVDAQNRSIQVYYNNKSGIDPLNTLTFKGRKSCWSNGNESFFSLFTPYSECSTFSSSGDTVFYKVCPIIYRSSSLDSSSNSIITSVNINGPESFFIIP